MIGISSEKITPAFPFFKPLQPNYDDEIKTDSVGIKGARREKNWENITSIKTQA
jgi:hypothetical protein